QAVREAVGKMPAGALLIVLAGYFVGTFCGAWVAARLTRIWPTAPHWPMTHAMTVGLVVMLAGIKDLADLPHPAWFVVCYFIVFPAAAFLGGRLVMGSRRAASER